MAYSADTMMVTRSWDKYSPLDGGLMKTYIALDDAEVNALVERSRQVHPGWSALPAERRAQVLLAVADLIQRHAEHVARLIHQETGKPIKDALESDVAGALSILHYNAKAGPGLLKPNLRPPDKSVLMGRLHWNVRTSRGVTAVISPWNYPLAIPASGLATTLIAGNTAILKPSELTPETGKWLVECFRMALKSLNLEPDVVQLALGDGETGKALCNAPVDYAIFTGSDRSGQAVRQALQARGKEASLELGGSDPAIGLPGCDWDAVTSYVLWARFMNAGQSCAAVKRFLVPRADLDIVLELLKAKIDELQPTPVISECQLQGLLDQLDDAKAQGCQVLTGGGRLDTPGFYMAPTLLTDISLKSRVWTEEVFGPILPVVGYDSVDEAVALANSSRFGLTASVFGPWEQARQVARQLHAGTVAINDTGIANYVMPSLPWQGVGSSGPGVSHGPEAILAATYAKIESLNLLYALPLFRKQPWHFAKTPKNDDLSLTHQLIGSFANESWLAKCSPRFLWTVWQHRSNTRL